MSVRRVVVAVLVLAGCSGEVAVDPPVVPSADAGTTPGATPPDAGAHADAGSSAGSDAGAVGTGPDAGETDAGAADAGPQKTELPCEISATLTTHCSACHGVYPAGGATFSMVTPADLAASSLTEPGMSIGQRAVIRMRNLDAPMP